MKHLITLSLCTLAMAWAMAGHAQKSPAPEAAPTGVNEPGNAASSGITGNDGSEPNSDGAGSRSDDMETPDYQERKPTGKETGDTDDFSGNEGAETQSKGTGTGHGATPTDANAAEGTRDSGGSSTTGK